MNIKEVEARTGLERSNIYFYEREGLITPARLSNGYRDYSEEDLEVLHKIKLLRSLQISLDDIRALKEETLTLGAALSKQIENLKGEKEKADYAIRLCEYIRGKETSFKNLNTSLYQNGIPEEPPVKENPFLTVPQEHVEVPPMFRRILARTMDLLLYVVLLLLIFSNFFHIFYNDLSSRWAFVLLGGAMIMMLLVEPFLISFFGTTLGKWLFGLKLTDQNGQRCTLQVAQKRTALLFEYWGFMIIPILNLYLVFQFGKQTALQKQQLWEKDVPIAYTQKDRSWYLDFSFLPTLAVFAAVLFVNGELQIIPPNRGTLTEKEFWENYRYYTEYCNLRFTLGSDSDYPGPYPDTYYDVAYDFNGTSYRRGWHESRLELSFQTNENGHITAVYADYITDEDDQSLSYPFGQLYLITMAFTGAEPSVTAFSPTPLRMEEAIMEHVFQDYSYTDPKTGITIETTYETTGYLLDGPFHPMVWLPPTDRTKDNAFALHFICTKN